MFLWKLFQNIFTRPYFMNQLSQSSFKTTFCWNMKLKIACNMLLCSNPLCNLRLNLVYLINCYHLFMIQNITEIRSIEFHICSIILATIVSVSCKYNIMSKRDHQKVSPLFLSTWTILLITMLTKPSICFCSYLYKPWFSVLKLLIHIKFGQIYF